MKLTIHQPNFMPYLGFFDKCDCSDVLVIYNSTQFKRSDFQNRNKLRNERGIFWLTVPVSFSFGEKISEVKIDNSKRWKEKHLKTIEMIYSKSKYFNDYFPEIKKIYNYDWELISDFNIALIKFFLYKLSISCKVVLSSELNIKHIKSDALIEICNKIGSKIYVSGIGGEEYLEFNKFKRENIFVEIQEYHHPIYRQNFDVFEKNLSVLDLLFNEGPNSLKIIRSGRKYKNGY